MTPNVAATFVLDIRIASAQSLRLMGRWVVALVLVATGAAHAESVLQRVSVGRGAAPSVTLELSAPTHPVVNTLAGDATHPPRIYVDLAHTTLAAGTPAVVGGTVPLLRVRTGQFDLSTARVVLDLERATAYTVRADETTLTITLAPPSREAHAPPIPTTEPLPPQAPPRAAVATPEPPRANVPTPPPPQAKLPPPPPPPPQAAPPTPTPAPPRMAAVPTPVPKVAVPTPAPPPTPAPRVPAPEPPPVRPVVVLDAGHGGHDPGAIGMDGIAEKIVALDVARRIAARLAESDPVEVVLTRDDDRFVSIDRRIARVGEAVLFLSVHANAAADPLQCGVEVFYGGGGFEPAAAGPSSPQRLGRHVASAIEQRVGPVRTIVRPGGFGVLARNAVPSILVEVGYLTNPGDATRIEDDAYRALFADAIADGMLAFLREPGVVRRTRARRPVAALTTCPRTDASCRPAAASAARSAARS